MSAREMYAMKRAERPHNWRSGHCNVTNPPELHANCHGGYDRRIKPIGWVACCCECHTTPAVEVAPSPLPVEDVEQTSPQPPDLFPGWNGFEVTGPCVIDELDEAAYHADPVPQRVGGSLSNSGAKVLIAPGGPARFAYQREHGRANKRAFDLGHAVHSRVLGVGAEVVRIEAPNWRTKAAQEARDAAYAEGKVPLLADEVDEVGLMAEAVLRHPLGRVLFEVERTVREQSLFWQDGATGVFRRARPDSRIVLPNGRTLCVDLKSTVSADPGDFGKTAANFGYHCQHPWYLDGLAAHGLADADSSFLFVLVEKEPPYLVSVVELDEDAVRIGRQTNRRAIDLYAECQGTGSWPGYSEQPQAVSLPYWFTKTHDEEYLN